MSYKPGAGASVPLQTQGQCLGRFVKVDPPLCESAADRDTPLGFVFQKTEETEVGKANKLICCSMHDMTSTWPSSIHFSSGEKCIYDAKDGKSGLSFLTWLPAPTFQICCTCKKNLWRQPAYFYIFPFSALMRHIPHCVVWRGGRMGFFQHTCLHRCRLL